MYPSLHTKAFDEELAQNSSTLDHLKESGTFLLLSINRYERKKNLPLALKTLGMIAYYCKYLVFWHILVSHILPLVLNICPSHLATLHNKGFIKTRLVMMGGHDPLCVENVEHLQELKALANDLNLISTGTNPSVIFRVSKITR